MARIAGVNIPIRKHVVIGLTSIYGIGKTRSIEICKVCKLDPAVKIKDLSEFAKKSGMKKSDLYGMDVSNSSELKRGAEAALSLLAEKYKSAVKNTLEMGLELTEDQLVDLTLVGYKNNSKFTSKRYIEEYILNNLNNDTLKCPYCTRSYSLTDLI